MKEDSSNHYLPTSGSDKNHLLKEEYIAGITKPKYLTPADILEANHGGPDHQNDNIHHKEVKMVVINEHLNFYKALLCSAGFLFLYIALYSA